VPEISRFYGIIIKMFFDDHLPPHFHAEYGDLELIVNINTLAIVAGKFPPRALGLVMEWTALHQDELKADWDKAKSKQSVDKISPLP
jgi:hypothetical protein